MCLDEGSQRTGRDRFHLYRVAAGSAAEVRTALALATTWGYIVQPQAAAAHALLDRIVAILWRLTHPKR
jgi:four helix bundle protein